MSTHIDEVKKREKDFHDAVYDTPLSPVDVEAMQNFSMGHSYATGNHYRSDNLRALHKIINEQWRGKIVLEYVCGPGGYAVYFGLVGAKEVYGFDISETAIRRARERVEAQGLADKVHLDVMDATKLDYKDDFFEIVTGHAVLHHVIKYPGIAKELYRVMKPGSKAYFFENLADFPLFRLWWKLKGDALEGEPRNRWFSFVHDMGVPIFAKEVREKFNMFSKVEIIGDDFLFSLKRFIWKSNMGRARRIILRGLKKADEILFKICPPLRRWGCFSYIILTK